MRKNKVRFDRLQKREDNDYYVLDNLKKEFSVCDYISKEDKQQCFDFAFDMTYGGKGQQRSNRSGSDSKRTKGQMFIDTFQGKMAEFALYRYLLNNDFILEGPNIEKYGSGEWDVFDLIYNKQKISIKSTKFFGQLLMLEKDDWDKQGKYIPNATFYKYTVLVRFSPNGAEIMEKIGLLNDNMPDNVRDILEENILNEEWCYDIPGFIKCIELVYLIRNKYIIPKYANINGSKKFIDVDNYYCQVGNMHSIEELIDLLRV